MIVTVKFFGGGESGEADIELGSETFEAFCQRVRKEGIFHEDEGYKHYVPPRCIVEVFTRIKQQAPDVMVAPVTGLIQAVILENTLGHACVQGLYFNGHLLPDFHICHWRSLKAGCGDNVAAQQERWVCTGKPRNLPPLYTGLKDFAESKNYQALT